MRILFYRLACVLLALAMLPAGAMADAAEEYEYAQNLLAKSRWEEAAAAFAALGGYEDAATLTVYCRAIAAAECGEYDLAQQGFAMLGDFRDCAFRSAYYTVRRLESEGKRKEAIAGYQKMLLYLDSAERVQMLRDEIAAEWAAVLAARPQSRTLFGKQAELRLGASLMGQEWSIKEAMAVMEELDPQLTAWHEKFSPYEACALSDDRRYVMMDAESHVPYMYDVQEDRHIALQFGSQENCDWLLARMQEREFEGLPANANASALLNYMARNNWLSAWTVRRDMAETWVGELDANVLLDMATGCIYVTDAQSISVMGEGRAVLLPDLFAAGKNTYYEIDVRTGIKMAYEVDFEQEYTTGYGPVAAKRSSIAMQFFVEFGFIDADGTVQVSSVFDSLAVPWRSSVWFPEMVYDEISGKIILGGGAKHMLRNEPLTGEHVFLEDCTALLYVYDRKSDSLQVVDFDGEEALLRPAMASMDAKSDYQVDTSRLLLLGEAEDGASVAVCDVETGDLYVLDIASLLIWKIMEFEDFAQIIGEENDGWGLDEWMEMLLQSDWQNDMLHPLNQVTGYLRFAECEGGEQ